MDISACALWATHLIAPVEINNLITNSKSHRAVSYIQRDNQKERNCELFQLLLNKLLGMTSEIRLLKYPTLFQELRHLFKFILRVINKHAGKLPGYLERIINLMVYTCWLIYAVPFHFQTFAYWLVLHKYPKVWPCCEGKGTFTTQFHF